MLPPAAVNHLKTLIASGIPALADEIGPLVEHFHQPLAATSQTAANAWRGVRAATVQTMTAKERLRSLVDDLSEEEAASALVIVESRRADPMLRALADAASDDEPSSPEEDDTARQALVAYQRGEALSPSELKSDLGIA